MCASREGPGAPKRRRVTAARRRTGRGSVADLVVELGDVEPGQVRAALTRALGDPTLQLGLWFPERHRWVDEGGAELEILGDDSRGVTFLGDQLAVLVHDPLLLERPSVLQAAGSAARLALENERLQAELRAQLAELRDSRARIVRSADEERRRLERDLHDGAQQRLLSLGMALQLLRPHTLDGEGEALLAENERELLEALHGLRDLARGIHPAILTDNGLAAAARTLAGHSPIPVSVACPEQRLPTHVETASYHVIAEALTNITRHAHATRARVSVALDKGCVRVEVGDDGVGGANPQSGTGLRGLADRVGALDGRFSIDSPSGNGTIITAEIPCSA